MNRINPAKGKKNVRLYALSLFMSCLFCLCLPINDLYRPSGRLMPYQPTWALLLGILIGAPIFFMVFVWATRTRTQKEERPVRSLPKRLAPYAVAPVAASVLSCIALYPGLFTVDSTYQLRQAMGESVYNAWHPIGHTLLFFTIPFKATGQIFSVTVAHLLFYCFTWAFMFATMEKLGCKRRWLAPIQACIVLIPTNLFMSMAMWKDIPFACAAALLTANLLRLNKDKALLKKNGFLLGTGAALGLVAVLRHNGPVVAPLVVVAFLLVYRKEFWRALIPVGTAVMMFACVQFVGFGLLHAKPNPPAVSYRWFTQIAAGILKEGGRISAEEQAKLETIMPREAWTQYYDPYINDPLLNVPGVNVLENLAANKRALITATAAMALKNPRKALNAELYITEITWRIRPYGPVTLTGYKNKLDDYGMQINQDAWLFGVYRDAMETVKNNQLLSLFFTHHGLYFVLTVFFLCIALARRASARALLCFTPVLLNVMSLWVSIPSQDYRYVYPTVMAFPLLAAFTLVSGADDRDMRKKRKEA